jgi:hypothetical protein
VRFTSTHRTSSQIGSVNKSIRFSSIKWHRRSNIDSKMSCQLCSNYLLLPVSTLNLNTVTNTNGIALCASPPQVELQAKNDFQKIKRSWVLKVNANPKAVSRWIQSATRSFQTRASCPPTYEAKKSVPHSIIKFAISPATIALTRTEQHQFQESLNFSEARV